MWKLLSTTIDVNAAVNLLEKHLETSAFLYSNIKSAGIKYQGLQFQAEYYGYYQNEQLVGIIAHCWETTVLMQCPDEIIIDSFDVEAVFTRPIGKIIGVANQVKRLIKGLPKQTFFCREEILFSKDLSDIIIPKDWNEEEIHFQDSDDIETLVKYRIQFEVESLKAPETPEIARRCRESIEGFIKDRLLFVLHRQGKIVAMCNFNASAKNIAQVGGMYVPREERGKRYSQAILREALIYGKKMGHQKAVLFTENPSAIKVYQSLGFNAIGILIIAFNQTPS